MNAITESEPTNAASNAEPAGQKCRASFDLRSMLAFVAAAAVLCGGFVWLGARWPALLLVAAGVTLAIRWTVHDLGMMVICGSAGGCLGGLCCAFTILPMMPAQSRGPWGLAALGLGLFGLLAGIFVAAMVALALRRWRFQAIEEQRNFATRLSLVWFACAALAMTFAALINYSIGVEINY